jgi:hypothetical protein
MPLGHLRVAVADGCERPGQRQAAAVHQPALLRRIGAVSESP